MLLRLAIIDVFDNISGYRRYKIIVFRRTPARGGYHGADSTMPVTLFGLLGIVERSGTDISHTLSFYFPN